MNEEKTVSAPQAEIDFFPWDNSTELKMLEKIAGPSGHEVRPLSDAGYMISRPETSVTAEAPWVFLDFDDTVARTTHDKKDCWVQLENMGLSQELIAKCDKLSRVDFGEAGEIYEPELEMRLVTRALKLVADGKLDDEIFLELSNMRKEIVFGDGMKTHGVVNNVRRLFESTRYSSTIYPDVEETIKRLRGDGNRPINIAILTYGNPHLQHSKTDRMLEEHPDLCAIFLTKTRKGEFFKELLEVNPFADMNLVYTYPETPKGVGIDFKNWHVMVTLFDDDPKQVASFNSFAKENGITGLGVVRVRREGAKRSGIDVEIPRGSAEVVPSDTLLDTEIFEEVLRLLEADSLEDYLLGNISHLSTSELIGNAQFNGLIRAIADRRRKEFYEVREEVLSKISAVKRDLPDDG